MIIIRYTPIITPLEFKGYQIGVLRLDLIHPEISGNKWFKLHLNLEAARQQKARRIITFGGAFSNHIAACATACKLAGFESLAIVRGEKTDPINHTLKHAMREGMQLEFVSREQYRHKTESDFIRELLQRFPDSYIIPEGGDNALGVEGCRAILGDHSAAYDHIFCAVGTGTTFRGLEQSKTPDQWLSGIPVLKGFDGYTGLKANYKTNYHFGGYASHTRELLVFKEWFEMQYRIPLDYVYTAKLCYAVFDLIQKNEIETGTRILIIHSGGLQGNAGYETRYNLKPSRQLIDAQG
ncbi:MAG: pyridoxal-phosphate dependent enzyme [Bacteroidetes bacterium]|nr:pyridoxal-phosphate dependent enzyme [Bacteroidota bacterium]